MAKYKFHKSAFGFVIRLRFIFTLCFQNVAIMQVLASQLHFQADRNAELAIPPLFWPVNCIKIGGHVALLSDPTVYSLYCGRRILLTHRRSLSVPANMQQLGI